VEGQIRHCCHMDQLAFLCSGFRIILEDPCMCVLSKRTWIKSRMPLVSVHIKIDKTTPHTVAPCILEQTAFPSVLSCIIRDLHWHHSHRRQPILALCSTLVWIGGHRDRGGFTRCWLKLVNGECCRRAMLFVFRTCWVRVFYFLSIVSSICT
jgi:hypothetical protein